MVATSLVTVATSLVMVATSLAMVVTSLVMVETPEALMGGSSKSTVGNSVAQKCSGAMEIQKYDQPTNGRTNGLTWVGARDTCPKSHIIIRWVVDPCPVGLVVLKRRIF